jgi:hypothetical protein
VIFKAIARRYEYKFSNLDVIMSVGFVLHILEFLLLRHFKRNLRFKYFKMLT